MSSHSRIEHLGPGVGTPDLSRLQATISVVLKCGPQSGSISITWALDRNADFVPRSHLLNQEPCRSVLPCPLSDSDAP